MARFKDVMPSQTGWIHELARGEVYGEAEKLLQMGNSFDPQQRVEESTIEFLTELRERFTESCRIFNGFSESGGRFQEVKIYSVAQTAADFMIFRNQVKLVVSNSAHGVIQIAFAQHARNPFNVDGSANVTTPSGPGQELLAQVGPFRDVYWTFQGEKVSPEQVAKFYFTEFARATRDTRKSKAGNQMLLEQIKTLLQEKGLDL